jgi:hypothetical protein
MGIKVWRGYSTDRAYQSEEIVLSIIATDSDVIYISDPDSGFDDERIEMIVDIQKKLNISLPKDPDGWAGLAMDNISGITYTSDGEETSDEFYEEVVLDEISNFEEARKRTAERDEAIKKEAARYLKTLEGGKDDI